MSASSVNQQFKTYMGKLAAAAQAGGPLGEYSSEKLEMLMEMDRTERFQHFCAEKLGEDATAPRKARRNKRAETAQVAAERIVDGSNLDIDNSAAMGLLELLAEQLGVSLISNEIKVVAEPKVAKPRKANRPTQKASKRTTRRARNAGQSDGSVWKKSTLTYLGYPVKVGKSFRHTSKAGTFVWTITEDIGGGKVIAEKN